LSDLSHGETELYERLTAPTGKQHSHSAAVRKLELYRRLTSEPIGMYHGAAVRQLHRRSVELVEATIERFQERKHRIQNPGAWMKSALEEAYCAPVDPPQEPPTDPRETKPQRRTSTDPTGFGDAVTGTEDSAGGYSWEKARRILDENDLLERIPDLSHWFEVVRGKAGRLYRPTDATRRVLDTD
jgi:hypothetical protein